MSILLRAGLHCGLDVAGLDLFGPRALLTSREVRTVPHSNYSLVQRALRISALPAHGMSSMGRRASSLSQGTKFPDEDEIFLKRLASRLVPHASLQRVIVVRKQCHLSPLRSVRPGPPLQHPLQ